MGNFNKHQLSIFIILFKKYNQFIINFINYFRYFMCSAGLFITIFTWEILNQRMLDDYFIKCKTEEDALETFGLIYSKLFIEFNNFYQKEPRNMMDFNTIIVI